MNRKKLKVLLVVVSLLGLKGIAGSVNGTTSISAKEQSKTVLEVSLPENSKYEVNSIFEMTLKDLDTQSLSLEMYKEVQNKAETTGNSDSYLLVHIPEGLHLVGEEIGTRNEREVFSVSNTTSENVYRIQWNDKASKEEKMVLPIKAEKTGEYKITTSKNMNNIPATEVTQNITVVQGEKTVVPMTTSADIQPMTAPTGTSISTVDEWNVAMTNTTDTEYYLVADLTLTTTATVSTNKQLDLNGHTLTFSGNNGKLLLKGYEDFTDFTIYNSVIGQGGIASTGHTTGYYRGPIYDGRPDNITSPNVGSNNQNANLVVIFKDVDVNSGDEFAYLFYAKEVLLKGNINIYTEGKGIVATNITFYGNETNPNDPENANVVSKTGTSANNPSEFAFYYGPLNFALAPNYGANAGWNQRQNELKFWVQKNASVYGQNNGTVGNGAPYQNVIANYRTVQNDGTLRAIAQNNGGALRTITSNGSDAQAPHAQIIANSGSVTEISTLGTQAYYGAIFSFKMNLIIDSPEIFDIRYFGTNQFFFAWDSGSRSTVSVKNMDHAVWSSAQSGVGNPVNIWQDVATFDITGLYTTARGVITSSNSEMAADFNFNGYSRWSNDILLPSINPEEEQATLVDDVYEVPNNQVGLSGTTDYTMPDGSHVIKPADGADLTMTVGTKTFTTTADTDGNWNFHDVDFTQFAGGTTGTINIVDKDKRTHGISIKLIDKLPPNVVTKTIFTTIGQTSEIPTDPKEFLLSYTDETTAVNNLIVDWITTQEEREVLVSTVGLKTAQISVTDEAGNQTIADVQIYVSDEETVTTADGSVRGVDFSMDLTEWQAASDDGKREFVLNNGLAKGFIITSSTVAGVTSTTIEDVTDDSTQFLIDYSLVGSERGVAYPITLTVGTATKTIYITFVEVDAILTVEFINEANQILSGYTVLIDAQIGDILDLTKNTDVVTKLESLANAGYEIIQRPENEEAVTIDSTTMTVRYVVQGVLSLTSVPSSLNFGSLTYNATTKRVEDPRFDERLVITDTRADVSDGWTITATLSSPMKNESGQELANALRYVYSGQETILNNNAQMVYVNSEGNAGVFDISESWGTTAGTDGVKLQIGSSDIVYTGNYTGVITWKVMAGQP